MKQSVNELMSADHDELSLLFSKLAVAIETNSADTFDLLDLFWARLAMHIRAEHLHLFPALLEDPSPETVERIDKLRDDHNFFMRELSGAVKSMRAGAANANTDLQSTLAMVKQRLEKHNEIEEAVVYPLADQKLGPERQARILLAMNAELENLPQRFSENRTPSRD